MAPPGYRCAKSSTHRRGKSMTLPSLSPRSISFESFRVPPPSVRAKSVLAVVSPRQSTMNTIVTVAPRIADPDVESPTTEILRRINTKLRLDNYAEMRKAAIIGGDTFKEAVVEPTEIPLPLSPLNTLTRRGTARYIPRHPTLPASPPSMPLPASPVELDSRAVRVVKKPIFLRKNSFGWLGEDKTVDLGSEVLPSLPGQQMPVVAKVEREVQSPTVLEPLTLSPTIFEPFVARLDSPIVVEKPTVADGSLPSPTRRMFTKSGVKLDIARKYAKRAGRVRRLEREFQKLNSALEAHLKAQNAAQKRRSKYTLGLEDFTSFLDKQEEIIAEKGTELRKAYHRKQKASTGLLAECEKAGLNKELGTGWAPKVLQMLEAERK